MVPIMDCAAGADPKPVFEIQFVVDFTAEVAFFAAGIPPVNLGDGATVLGSREFQDLHEVGKAHI